MRCISSSWPHSSRIYKQKKKPKPLQESLFYPRLNRCLLCKAAAFWNVRSCHVVSHQTQYLSESLLSPRVSRCVWPKSQDCLCHSWSQVQQNQESFDTTSPGMLWPPQQRSPPHRWLIRIQCMLRKQLATSSIESRKDLLPFLSKRKGEVIDEFVRRHRRLGREKMSSDAVH